MQVNHNKEARTGSRQFVATNAATERLANRTAVFDTSQVSQRLREAQRTREFAEAANERPSLRQLVTDDAPALTPGAGGGGEAYTADSIAASAKLERRARWRRIVILAAIALVLWYVFRKQTTN